MIKFIIFFFLFIGSAFPCTRYWVGGGSANTWAATANTNWSISSGGSNNAAVPSSSDDVCFDSNSGSSNSVIAASITIKSLTTTGYIGILTQNSAINVALSGGTGLFFTNSFTYVAGAATSEFLFLGSTTQSITSGSQILPTVVLLAAATGILNQADNLSISGQLLLEEGTFNTQNFNITATVVQYVHSGATTINLGSSAISCSGTGLIWNFGTTTGLTFNSGTSTILITDTSTTSKTFSGGGLNYNNVTLPADGTGTISVTGGNTFNVLTLVGKSSVIFSSSVTQTATNFSFNGTSGNLVTITASTGGTAAILSKVAGIVCANYVSLKDSTVTGGASFYASNSTNVSGNTGWTFGACPSATTGCSQISLLGAGVC